MYNRGWTIVNTEVHVKRHWINGLVLKTLFCMKTMRCVSCTSISNDEKAHINVKNAAHECILPQGRWDWVLNIYQLRNSITSRGGVISERSCQFYLESSHTGLLCDKISECTIWLVELLRAIKFDKLISEWKYLTHSLPIIYYDIGISGVINLFKNGRIDI